MVLTVLFERYLRDHVVQSPYFRNAVSSYQKSICRKVMQLEWAKLVLELKS